MGLGDISTPFTMISYVAVSSASVNYIYIKCMNINTKFHSITAKLIQIREYKANFHRSEAEGVPLVKAPWFKP